MSSDTSSIIVQNHDFAKNRKKIVTLAKSLKFSIQN